MQPVRAMAEELPILIVDDEAEILGALSRSLEHVGYATLTADTAEKALALLRRQSFGCALVDLRMPGLGGYGFIRECRREHGRLPLVVVTGHGDMHDVIECLRLGVADFVQKPWSETELRTAVLRAMDRPLRGAAGEPVAAERRDLGREVIEALRTGACKPPTFPEVALEARRISESDDGTPAQLKLLVERNPALTARIVRLASSSYFAGYGKVTGLQAAITRIGFREVGQVIDALVVRRFFHFGERDPELADLLSGLWQHSFARATAMRFFAQMRPDLRVPPARAFLAGLICDIGAPFLVQALEDRESPPPSAEVLGALAEPHAEVSALLAEAWNLPADVLTAVRYHHEAAGASPVPGILLALGAAELACARLGMKGELRECLVGVDVQRMLNLSSADLTVLQGRTGAYLEAVTGAVEAMPVGADPREERHA